MTRLHVPRGDAVPHAHSLRAVGRMALACSLLAQVPCRLAALLTSPSQATVTISLKGDTLALPDTARLTAEVRVNDEVRTSIPLSWASSDPAVATVDSTGLVRGAGRGRATIRVALHPAVLAAFPARDSATVW